jgi:hypothetical protein
MIDSSVHHFFNGSSSHDRWETFTSNDVSSKKKFSMNAIGRFDGITTSSAMTKSSPASTKTKRVVETIWYLYSEGVDVFI